MSDTFDLAHRESQQVFHPKSMLEVIAQAVTDPRCDVAKMRELFALQKEIQAEERRISFDEAMTRLQAKIPQVAKLGQGKNSKFAKYEDIALILTPMLAEEGFSLSFSEDEQKDGKVRFSLEISRAGHSKFYHRTVSTDAAASNREGKSIRPAIQDDGSTTSYARRYLVKMAFNLVEKGEDVDGDSPKAITADQCIEIRDLIRETKSNEANFLELIAGAKTVEEIQQRDYRRIVNALQTKKRNMK